MKNVYDNYGISKETLDKERAALNRLFEYNSRKCIMEHNYELYDIVNELISATGLTGGHLLYCSSELDKCEWILHKLKKIPGLKFIIRKLEES